MRVGEVLELKVKNVHGRKLVLSEPKSGNQTEIVFIPKKVADRLREYIASVKIENDHRVFPWGYPSGQGSLAVLTVSDQRALGVGV